MSEDKMVPTPPPVNSKIAVRARLLNGGAEISFSARVERIVTDGKTRIILADLEPEHEDVKEIRINPASGRVMIWDDKPRGEDHWIASNVTYEVIK